MTAYAASTAMQTRTAMTTAAAFFYIEQPAGVRQSKQLQSHHSTSVSLCVGAHRAASSIISSCCLLTAPASPAQHTEQKSSQKGCIYISRRIKTENLKPCQVDSMLVRTLQLLHKPCAVWHGTLQPPGIHCCLVTVGTLPSYLAVFLPVISFGNTDRLVLTSSKT
jgi:hypothetical protein